MPVFINGRSKSVTCVWNILSDDWHVLEWWKSSKFTFPNRPKISSFIVTLWYKSINNFYHFYSRHHHHHHHHCSHYTHNYINLHTSDSDYLPVPTDIATRLTIGDS